MGFAWNKGRHAGPTQQKKRHRVVAFGMLVGPPQSNA